MIRSMFAYLFRNKKEPRLKDFDKELDSLKEYVSFQKKSLEKDKFELEKARKDILDQRHKVSLLEKELSHKIADLERKVKPEIIWVNAFSLGFSKAWDFIEPIFNEGIKKSEELIKRKVIDDYFPQLDSLVNERVFKAGNGKSSIVREVKGKIEEFMRLKVSSSSDIEKKECDNYIEALNWVVNEALNGN